MKLSDALKLAEQTQKDLENLEITVKDAAKARDKLNTVIIRAEENLGRKRNDDTYPTKFANGIIKSMKTSGVLSTILIKWIDRAAIENTEFERSAYKAALYRVANEDDIYKMFVKGAGWNISLRPSIVFEEEAGDINDWAEAVEAYREDLEVKVGNDRRSKKGEKATAFWRDRVFGTGLEVITINARLGYSTGTAPFWGILNYGSQPMSSDRPDNSYNPIPAGPTDFIGDAEREIISEFRTYMEPERDRWFREIELMQEEINNAKEILQDLDRAIASLTPDKKKNRNFLERLFGGMDYIDSDVLPKTENDLRVGDKFQTPSPESTDVNVIKKAGRFLKGLVKKAIRKVRGYDD